MNKELYSKEIKMFSMDLSDLNEKTIMISGATGMIGSYLVDVIMNNCPSCHIVVLGRNKEKIQARFHEYLNNENFSFYEIDINYPLSINEKIDYVIHAASNTHPLAYATDPIGTITANVIGLKNLLDYAFFHNAIRFIFVSSVEVYGENRGDTELFDEKYCGYIDCNSLRSGYPESKRVGEALCQAYIQQKKMDIVIPRLPRVFGPTLLPSDTKAMSQFLQKALNGEDIVLKSEGSQYYSYLYVADAVSGLLSSLMYGKNGEAYNFASQICNIKLKDLASMVAESAGVKVVFDLPDEIEKKGYSMATKALLNPSKANEIHWKAEYNLKNAILQTLSIMR